MERNLKSYLIITLKGMAMGAADIVPGVSGGTIAFISGIYRELIDSIKSINHQTLKLLLSFKLVAFWKEINGNFLLALGSGILISILSLVRLIHYLLEQFPVILWSFFFGLIVASAIVIGKKITKWNLGVILTLILGIGIAFFINISAPAETTNELWFIFISGMIAICAMILPGISGSFILLLLKKYEYITGALKEFDLPVIITFAVGCGVGLISFSNVLSWMFKKYYNMTIGLLTGFMIGSLNIVWPWKNVIETRINSKGVEVPMLYESVLPQNYLGENNMLMALFFMLVGFIIIVSLEKFSSQKEQFNS
jgi:putative membrane protein